MISESLMLTPSIPTFAAVIRSPSVYLAFRDIPKSHIRISGTKRRLLIGKLMALGAFSMNTNINIFHDVVSSVRDDLHILHPRDCATLRFEAGCLQDPVQQRFLRTLAFGPRVGISLEGKALLFY